MTENNRTDLTPEETYVIVDKGTERPYTGKLLNEHRKGTFFCKRCNSPLYSSSMKFDSGCGRPAFDDALPGQVKETTDADGHRVEITCMNCGGHLGHVFRGEKLTEKNTRHCVNSLSMGFSQNTHSIQSDLETATFGGGCYRCTEAIFQRLKGVKIIESGFMGGTSKGPSYEDICNGKGAGHIEVIQIHYDPEIISYQTLLDVFFASHNPTQLNAQGNDVGEQYASVIFTHTSSQQQQAEETIHRLKASKNYLPHTIVTQIRQATDFWKAEGYHQNFYNNNSTKPYCQLVIDPKLAKLYKNQEELIKDEYKKSE